MLEGYGVFRILEICDLRHEERFPFEYNFFIVDMVKYVDETYAPGTLKFAKVFHNLHFVVKV